jgi:hypothetical protein
MTRRAFKLALVAVALAFALGFLYVGSAHRDRCLAAGASDCSLLPWSGDYSRVGESSSVFGSSDLP